jgi:small-conductance mechanosensitive channel
MPRFSRHHEKPAHRPVRARTLTLQAMQGAKRARRELALLVPLTAAVIFLYVKREAFFGTDTPVRVATSLVLLGLGYVVARDFGRWVRPWLFRRMDPANAGTVGFLIRLAMLLAAILVSLRVAGLKPQTLAVGGAVFAVVFGLAAQQTLGNVIAGLVLISAQPFRVGDRVRLQAGGVAGSIEGVVASHGLLYTTFRQSDDSIMVPNNIVLSAAVVPLREPAGVDLRARLRPDVKPTDVQTVLEEHVRTPVRHAPSISLEEIDADEVVVRITATPEHDNDGPRLADEILAAIAELAQEGHTEERLLARDEPDEGSQDEPDVPGVDERDVPGVDGPGPDVPGVDGPARGRAGAGRPTA